jgi:hypothetical protein
MATMTEVGVLKYIAEVFGDTTPLTTSATTGAFDTYPMSNV